MEIFDSTINNLDRTTNNLEEAMHQYRRARRNSNIETSLLGEARKLLKQLLTLQQEKQAKAATLQKKNQISARNYLESCIRLGAIGSEMTRAK